MVQMLNEIPDKWQVYYSSFAITSVGNNSNEYDQSWKLPYYPQCFRIL